MKITTKLIMMLSITIGSNSCFASVQINTINVGPQLDDPKNKFSLLINLTSSENIQNWQFGFYMPRLFRTTSSSNSKLNMSICDADNSNLCTQLIYATNKFTANDLSSGFTTILRPANQFALQAKHSYLIKLLHNSSAIPKNYSALPQSFFLINNNQIIDLPTTPAKYIWTKPNSVEVKKHLTQEWQNSNLIMPIINVVPSPQQVELHSGKYTIGKAITINNQANLSRQSLELWRSAINNDLSITPQIVKNTQPADIVLTKVPASTIINNPEGYIIDIHAKQIQIKANTEAGFFYALQTMRQLWFQQKTIVDMQITDYPRFKYRGLMLDVARHYLNIDEIKQIIDISAANKLNTLHLHLSDDEAFRLNLPDYPELANIGATRGIGKPIGPKAMIQHNLSKSKQLTNPATIIETGSYSPQQISQLINYANQRQITLIPELDIPGHSRALMKALPNVFYDPADSSEYSGYGDNALPICAYDNDSKFGKAFTQTLNNILIETAKLFNNQSTIYAINFELGVGGDEVAKNTWTKSPLCNNQSEWKNLSTIDKEHHFFNLLTNNLNTSNILLSGWHELTLNNDKVGNSTIKPNDTAHIWVWGNYSSSKIKAVNLANNNYPVVLAYSDSLYFDMPYTASIDEPGLYWATQFGDTYAVLKSGILADNTISQIKANYKQNILGLEGAAWSDVIPDFNHLQYMLIPKISGLAEASWSNKDITNQNGLPNWHSLAKRLGCNNTGYLGYLNQTYHVNYRGYPQGIIQEAHDLCNFSQ